MLCNPHEGDRRLFLFAEIGYLEGSVQTYLEGRFRTAIAEGRKCKALTKMHVAGIEPSTCTLRIGKLQTLQDNDAFLIKII